MEQTAENTSILLVEDNEVDVMGVKRAFKKSNFANPIVVVSDGIEALGILRDGKSMMKPYLILLDLNMPRMNGIEFLQEVRKDIHLKQSIIFVLTTSYAQEDRDKAYDHNIAGYIVKGRSTDGFVDVAGLVDRYTQICTLP